MATSPNGSHYNLGLERFLDHDSITKLKTVLKTIIQVHGSAAPPNLQLRKIDTRDVLLETSRFLQEHKPGISQILATSCIVYVLSVLLYACKHVQLYMHTMNIQVNSFQLVSVKYQGPAPVPGLGYLQSIASETSDRTMSMATFVNLQTTEICNAEPAYNSDNSISATCSNRTLFTVDITNAWLHDKVNNTPLFHQRVNRREILATRLLRKLKRLANANQNERIIQLLAVTTSTGLSRFKTVLPHKQPVTHTLPMF
jgi:hypothetical protein